MTVIHPHHLIGEHAVSIVRLILSQADALPGTVAHDYGEDLIVHTQECGYADPFTILVQVKGTSLKVNKDGSKSFSLESHHLRRWLSHITPVIVCIVDFSDHTVYYVDPKHRFTLWDAYATSRKSLTCRLRKRDIFDANSAREKIWECRIRYFAEYLAIIDHRISEAESFGTDASHLLKRLSMDKNVLVLNFLKIAKVIRGDDFSESFRISIRNSSYNLSRDLEAGDSNSVSLAFTLSILGAVHDVCGQGLPANVIESASYLAAVFFRERHSKEWAEADGHFHSRWLTAS